MVIFLLMFYIDFHVFCLLLVAAACVSQCHNQSIFDTLYYPNHQEVCSKLINSRMIKTSYAIHLLLLQLIE